MVGAKTERTLKVTEKPGVSKDRQLADVALDPLFGAAVTCATFTQKLCGDTDINAVYEALHDRAKAIRGNKLTSAEDLLTGQAAALHAIFLELTRRSGANLGEFIQAAETYMRLALKAQAQCRATLETLAAIKNPPVVYARQMNIATGHQQVNNSPGALRAGETAKAPNEVLETQHDESKRLESGPAGEAIRTNSAMEAVGAIDGATNGIGQVTRKQQRLQRRKAPGS
jgi:hypothetical protein